jgi:hypothetical protein
MKLRVRARDLSMRVLLNDLKVPDFPDWVIDLPESMPERFSGKASVSVGGMELAVRWDFPAGLVSHLLGKLNEDSELDSASEWGPSTFVAWVQGNESQAQGLIGITVER